MIFCFDEDLHWAVWTIIWNVYPKFCYSETDYEPPSGEQLQFATPEYTPCVYFVTPSRACVCSYHGNSTCGGMGPISENTALTTEFDEEVYQVL